MRILPVLDLMKGQVVRGVAGRREEYRPIVSRLIASSDPVAMAEAFQNHFGWTELYLADLDALAGQPPALAIYDALQARGFRLWVDAGIRHCSDAAPLAGAGIDRIVAGLETLAGPAVLAELCREYSSHRIVFSLDLKIGVPLCRHDVWQASSAWETARRAVACGIRRLIVLDLRRVGVGEGTGTEELCSRLVTEYPELEVASGGGIRGIDDLRRLYQCGVQVALVASALHDGPLNRSLLSSEGIA